MLIPKCSIELENTSVEDLKEIEQFIENLKSKNISLYNDLIYNSDDNSIKTEHFIRLNKFKDVITTKQKQVFDYFMTNPGPLYGDDLRKNLSILQPQGALPGIFKATHRWVSMGGAKCDCPFFSIEWNSVRHCNKYRGLTPEEISHLNTI